jgi:hypothetical protein
MTITIHSALRKVIKRMHYPLEVMLICVRWYAAYPLSLRHVEEKMAERGVQVALWTATAPRSTSCCELIGSLPQVMTAMVGAELQRWT